MNILLDKNDCIIIADNVKAKTKQVNVLGGIASELFCIIDFINEVIDKKQDENKHTKYKQEPTMKNYLHRI